MKPDADAQQLYAALVLWSPPPIITHDSEKFYLSKASPTTTRQLTRLDEPAIVDLTVVVPAYNETERLPEMMAATIAHLAPAGEKAKRTFEILIVDDGSSDGTSATALALAKKYKDCDIKVVTLEKNIGKGGAVRHGMLFAGGRRLLMADADGASRIEDLEGLWTAMDDIAPEDAPGVVVGSRAHLVKSDAVVKVGSGIYTSYLQDADRAFPAALLPAERAHVRAAHDPAHCRGGAHSRHAVWVQALLARGGAADLPRTAPADVDLRRRVAAAGEAAARTRSGGADRVARGRGQQAQRRHRVAADAARPAHRTREPPARALDGGACGAAEDGVGMRGVLCIWTL